MKRLLITWTNSKACAAVSAELSLYMELEEASDKEPCLVYMTFFVTFIMCILKDFQWVEGIFSLITIFVS